MQRRRGKFLAAARFAFDQYRKWRVGILAQLRPQFFHRRAVAHQIGGAGRLRNLAGQQFAQDATQGFGVGRLGHEVGGAQGPGMAGVYLVALSGQNDNRHQWRQGQ